MPRRLRDIIPPASRMWDSGRRFGLERVLGEFRSQLDRSGRSTIIRADLRLTLINQFYAPDLSPTAHLCASLAEHRASMGDEVTVICGRGGYMKQVEAGQSNGVRVMRVWTAQLGSRGLLTRLLDWITFYVVAMFGAAILPRQDLIVCLTTPPYIVLAGLLQKLFHPKTRLVLWNMDCYPEAVERTGMLPAGGLISDLLRALNRAIFRRVDELICLDSAMRQLLLSQYKPRDRELPCDVIPNWERLALFPAESRHTPWEDPIVKSLQGRFVVLYLGNAGYGHEFATMIEAADRLRAEPITFLFVGGGAMRARVEAHGAGPGFIEFPLSRLCRQGSNACRDGNCGLALITLENYAAGVMSPSKLHSNLAMGLPILYVGPAGTNVDEAIARFACGTSVRPGDVEGAVRFLRGLMHDRAKQAELRCRAERLSKRPIAIDRLFPGLTQCLPGYGTPAGRVTSPPR